MLNVIQNTIGSLRRVSASSFIGMLDTYTGADVAYSLRRLSSTYTGNCIIVRRSSDNEDLAIGFNSNNVLDTAALLTHVGVGNDGYVTTWYDQSGNGNDAIQNAAAIQPKIVNSGYVCVDTDSNPALNFASNDRFTATSSSLSQPITSFSLHNSTVFGKSIYDGDSNRSILRDVSLTSVRIYSGAWLYSPEGNSSSRKLTYGLHNGSFSQVSFNDSAVTTGNASANGFDKLNLSVLGGFSGLMQEIVFYESNQSSNKNDIFSNINAYYSVY